MNIILSIPSKTIREIQRQLQIPLYIKRTPPDSLGLVIRWGNTKTVHNSKVLNKADAIRLVADKKRCRELLHAHNIPTPEPSESDFPIVARKTKHSSGSGFFYCVNRYELQQAKKRGATYFSKYYPKREEYRVHIADGRVLLMSEKVGDITKKIWNKHRSGFLFRHLHRHEWLNDTILRQATRYAKQAIELVGLDFGALDILVNRQLQTPIVICEINSCPALSPLAVEKYVVYFKEKLLDNE